MSKREDVQVFRVEGFSCANCAGKFEQNVKKLPGVVDAKVNFGASKISVEGEATPEELEKAGAFENLKIYAEQQKDMPKENISFFEKHRRFIFSLIFITAGYVSFFINGEDHILTILLFLSAILIGGFSLFKVGIENLLHFYFDMKTLMTIAVIGAAFIGEWAEGAVVVVLYAISEVLERYSMDHARQSIQSLMKIAPKEALIRRGSEEKLVPVNDINVGDIMIVKPGQKIAMDGTVIKGASTINQAAITGESTPVSKTVDDEVFAGTLNEEGVLEVKITKLVKDTTISKIIELVEEAQAERAPTQAFIDKFAKFYTPVIMVISAFVMVIPPLFTGDWMSWIYQGLSILVVGCPCALVISTPISIVSAIGNAAKKGVLIKGGIYLEQLGKINAIAFDKTGTLTKGVPIVTDYEIYKETLSEQALFSIIGALENQSNHPIASAMIKKAEELNSKYSKIEVEQYRSITGKGIKGTINGTNYMVGSPIMFENYMTNSLVKKIKLFQNEGKTVLIVGTEKEILAMIAVRDQVREVSREVIHKLHELGIKKTIMLTGDNAPTANSIAQLVGISEVQSELMPKDKLNLMKELRSRYHSVAMVGDGVNDAPALAASTVGIAMGGAGSDTALETADVALMGDDLRKLPFTIKLSRKTLTVIKTNIVFALSVKIIALLLVIPNWLTLWIAIASDMGATLLVSLNSMRLLRIKE